MAAAASAAPAILTDADRAERALRIPPSDRKPADILSILKWAKEFVKLPEEIPLERLCAVMELREYHAKQCCLFRQGDEGDSYYVVFSGEVGMYQEADDGDGERAVATRRRRREKRIVLEDSGGDCAATDADEDRE